MSKIDTPSGIPEDDFLREGLVDRLSQYVQADPKAWHVRYNLAVALAQQGELDHALEHFRLVLAESPKHLESMINMGGIHLARGQGDQALKILTSALRVWDVPIVRANLGMAYLQLGQYDEAERMLKGALAAAPNMPDAWNNLSTACLLQDNYADAVKAAQRALEYNPGMAMAHNNLAAALVELGELDQAREHAQKALDGGFPVHGALLERLGMQAEAGQPEN